VTIFYLNNVSSLFRLAEWIKVFNDTFCIVYSTIDLRILKTPLVSSTFSFNIISVLSCRSVLLFGETGVHGENHRPDASRRKNVSCKVASSTPCNERNWNS